MRSRKDSHSDASSSNQIQQQGFGYRRGFVLGLTLAEAALLLLFVIMLLLVIGFERRDREISSQAEMLGLIRSEVPPNTEPVAYITEALQKYTEVMNAVTEAGAEWDEDFIELVRAAAESTKGDGLIDIRQALAEKEAELARMIEVVRTIEERGSLQDVVNRVTEQESVINNQRGQIVDLRARLGSGIFPSCWTRENGEFDYILDVVLESNGIRVRESTPPERATERERLPLSQMNDPFHVYSQSAFLSETRALYNWSVTQECRFYVTIFDGTQTHEKELYKDLMRAVEGHFYKRQKSDAPPF